VDQPRGWLVARTRSHQPHAQAEALPPWDALPLALGTPQAGAVDQGSCSATTSAAMAARAMEPSLAPGRTPPQPSWPAYGAPQPAPPPADASPQVPRADTLHTAMGRALDRWRTWTVAPVLGMRTDLWGCRPGSRRGLQAAAGEGGLGWLAGNVKRLPSLTMGSGCLRLLEEAGGKV
jgi:hypothetical protein